MSRHGVVGGEQQRGGRAGDRQHPPLQRGELQRDRLERAEAAGRARQHGLTGGGAGEGVGVETRR